MFECHFTWAWYWCAKERRRGVYPTCSKRTHFSLKPKIGRILTGRSEGCPRHLWSRGSARLGTVKSRMTPMVRTTVHARSVPSSTLFWLFFYWNLWKGLKKTVQYSTLPKNSSLTYLFDNWTRVIFQLVSWIVVLVTLSREYDIKTSMFTIYLPSLYVVRIILFISTSVLCSPYYDHPKLRRMKMAWTITCIFKIFSRFCTQLHSVIMQCISFFKKTWSYLLNNNIYFSLCRHGSPSNRLIRP